MALIQCSFFAQTLGLTMSMNVIIPERSYGIGVEAGRAPAGDKYPVLYLLHGLSDDHSIWLRRTSVERYAAEYGIAVVMPEVHRSFYTNMKSGLNYWEFVSEELPHIAQSLFPISDKREDSFAAGLSMGGYGAMKLGLGAPGKFAAVASLSGAMDIAGLLYDGSPFSATEYKWIFGSQEEAAGSDDDLFALADRAVAGGISLPKLYQCCGTEDFLYSQNVRFRDHVRSLGIALDYEEGPGDHNWGYWDEHIQRVLAWLPLQNGKA
ncbi:alpha/beta hydrolase [Cohnella sp. GCM10020058]|uniref:alpha/beta hydrolase n=1 Tax=Cohnella sp. GCM10020058 TaxID=3317330 RepID=UPI00364193C2